MNIDSILNKYNSTKDNLLLILHDVQNQRIDNYIDKSDIIQIAEFLNLKLSHIYGVINYYGMFHTKPRGNHIITICNSPVCNLKNSKFLIQYFENKLGIKIGETTLDKKFTLESVECLGHCLEAPVMVVDDVTYGNLNKDKADKILKQFT
ncbi:MAG: NAD(P)H-dependent oxidoreductase subunit E [Bacteroidales bacterium]|jgi:NADH-quinone oxidoreductase subunit E|nr:NAD(P)H-dependent oxidoreductase subunit E [Bacteroidales bacterium]